MTIHLGNVPASSTIYIPFGSYNSTGASSTISGLATTDILLYKNGSTTERASQAGYTLLDTDGIDFDSKTGINGFSVDLSDNTDAGFYSVGGFYWIVVASITVDSQTVNFVAATFRLVAAEGVTGKPKVDVDAFGGTAGTFSGGRPEVNTTHIAGAAVNTASAQLGVNVVNAAGTAWNSGAIGANTLATDTLTAAKIAADAIGASELAADAVAEIAAGIWDLDATGHQTTGTFGQAIGDPAANTATIYAAVVTNAAGTDVAADIIAIKAETASILTDTAEIGTAGAGLTNINLPDQSMNITGDITGNLSGSVGSVTGAVGSVTGNVGGNVTGSIGSLAVQAKADVNAEVDTALADYDGPTHAELTTLIGTPADTDVSTDIANVQTAVDGISAGSGLDAAETRAAIGLASANLDTQLAAIQNDVTAILEDTGTTLPSLIGDLNDLSFADIWGAQLTESYAANGVAPTAAQLLFAVHQREMEFNTAGTSITVRKLDGVTPAFVITMDDAVQPTDSTRA